MRIGILTMHGVVHHGSVLQTFATQEIIKQLGHEAKIINYRYPNEWHFNNGRKKSKIKFKSIIAKYLRLKPTYKRFFKIKGFMEKHYSLTKEYKSPDILKKFNPEFDVYLSGSDQIWNPRFMYGDPTFMLAFVTETKKKISLSSSFACHRIPDSMVNIYKKYLSQYSHLSVREKQGHNILIDQLGLHSKITLDPTLLLNRDFWSTYCTKPQNTDKYIFMYMLEYAYNPTPYIYDVAKYMATKYGYSLYCSPKLPTHYNIHNIDAKSSGIEEFLSLIKNASLVITSSFHGTAFAINFGIPLVAVVPQDSNDDRLTSLLEILEIPNCIVKYGTPMDDINPFYDIDTEQENLQTIREDSILYLKNAIEN